MTCRPSIVRSLTLLALCGLCALASFGCAFGEIYPNDPFKREHTLREAQERYTWLVRWSRFEKASKFVDGDAKEQFLDEAPSMRELRFTDYELDSFDLDEETGEGTVEVTYFAYQPFSPIEISIRETQHWARDGVGNNWKVTPTFEGLDQILVHDTARR